MNGSSMGIYIPTMGRIHKQHTWNALANAGIPCTLVCPKDELEVHNRMGRHAISPPEYVQRIAPTRMWIMDRAEEDVVCMMDDDLTFYRRRTDEPDKFRNARNADIQVMIGDLHVLMKTYAHGSIAMREGGNRDTEPHKFCTRVARVIAYQKDVFFAEKADFTNSTVMDDFEVTLHLLTRGIKSVVLNTFVQNQVGSGTAGGASLYRDLEMHRQAALKLASRYPQFVKTVEKTTKSAWGGATRTDVIVQWKHAFDEGLRNTACKTS